MEEELKTWQMKQVWMVQSGVSPLQGLRSRVRECLLTFLGHQCIPPHTPPSRNKQNPTQSHPDPSLGSGILMAFVSGSSSRRTSG